MSASAARTLDYYEDLLRSLAAAQAAKGAALPQDRDAIVRASEEATEELARCRVALREGDAPTAIVAMHNLELAYRVAFFNHRHLPDWLAGRRSRAPRARGASAGGRKRAERMREKHSVWMKAAKEWKKAHPTARATEIAKELAPLVRSSWRTVYPHVLAALRQ